ncbi:MAG: recombinase family protein [Desulfobacterales bacterium]|nr:recombinase family protein [Desulfobacterales bacterium]
MKAKQINGNNGNNGKNLKTEIRCAIYCRASTTNGLDQEFTSLDSQREACESYVSSQKTEGWTCLPEKYNDGGYSGGNLERPALKRLLADIEAGKIDCVLTYKIDRASRSLADFVKLMEIFEKHKVSFISVTQMFNTANSMGRLTLNLLITFSEFERSLIQERTRDKMAAARRRGKWTGGTIVLGYDVDPKGGKININEEEAFRVKEIFELYLEKKSLIETVKELNNRGWTMKKWITRRDKTKGGRPFNKNNLLGLLTNVIYIGKIKYRDEVYNGEHKAIIDEALWQDIQKIIKRNGTNQNGTNQNQSNIESNKYTALLKDLLYCVCCDASMTHSYTLKKGKRYRYYICLKAQKQGWESCPTKSIPAPEVEKFVIEQIRCIGKDKDLFERTFDNACIEITAQVEKLEAEKEMMKKKLSIYNKDMGKLIASGEFTETRLADLQEQITITEKRIAAIFDEIKALHNSKINKEEMKTALSYFEPLWEEMSMLEQSRLLHLLIEKIGYDGKEETIEIKLRSSGIKRLIVEALQAQ